MTWNRRLVSLFAISLIVGLASVARAQVTTGTISGTATDPNGAVVAGANVKATNLDMNSSRTTSSDSDGHFVFTLLPPGRYRVEDGKVITKVEAAWNEAWVGGEQTRFVRFEGDRLFIESASMPHPNRDNEVVRVIVIWEREK